MKAPPKRMGRPTSLPPNAKSFLLRLPPELLQDLRTLAGNQEKSANEVIWKALAAFWEKHPAHDAIVAVRTATTGENSGGKLTGRRKSGR